MIRRQLTCLSAFALVFLLSGLPAATVAAAQGSASGAGASSSPLPAGWRLPLDGSPIVLRAFAPPPADQPWQRGHRGIDLAALPGALVRASASGVVGFAGPVAGRWVVVLLHGALRSTYEPVRPLVRVGQRVGSGQVVGSLEPLTQHCGRPCLHWGLLRGSVYVDPWPARSPVRLLPLSGGPEAQPTHPVQPTDPVGTAASEAAAGSEGSEAAAGSKVRPTRSAPLAGPAVTTGAAVCAGLGWARRRSRARSPAR